MRRPESTPNQPVTVCGQQPEVERPAASSYGGFPTRFPVLSEYAWVKGLAIKSLCAQCVAQCRAEERAAKRKV